MTASADGGPAPAVPTEMAPAPHRRILFFAVVVGANLQALDTTMATVALPHMQRALSATHFFDPSVMGHTSRYFGSY
jgi:hypothetical protein